METPFQQVRTHLGVETQRQWSGKAIAGTTPILMELFSLVTLLANTLILRDGIVARPSAWYSKTLPTFSDALALVRSRLWAYWTFHISFDDPDMGSRLNLAPKLERSLPLGVHFKLVQNAVG